jgi:type IV secretion system protein VirB4
MGHTFVFGPAGAGKSTFLCLMESQFLKYRNAGVIILDKDKSARSITMASGGVYTELSLQKNWRGPCITLSPPS